MLLQLTFAYSANTKAEHPCHLIFTGVQVTQAVMCLGWVWVCMCLGWGWGWGMGWGVGGGGGHSMLASTVMGLIVANASPLW